MKLFSLAVALLALALPVGLLITNASNPLMLDMSAKPQAVAHAHAKLAAPRTYAALNRDTSSVAQVLR